MHPPRSRWGAAPSSRGSRSGEEIALARQRPDPDDDSSPFARTVKQCLCERLSPIIVGAVMRSACGRCHASLRSLEATDLPQLLGTLERSLTYYLEPDDVQATLASLHKLGGANGAGRAAPGKQTVMDVKSELDIHHSRTRALELGKEIGLSSYDAIKVATVVSELTRNVVQYAGQGTVKLEQVVGVRRGLRVVVSDSGPGIPHLDEVLHGHYRSKTGLGMGIKGSKRIMDVLEVDSVPGRGTVVTAVKYTC